jgi:hypothetical protein
MKVKNVGNKAVVELESVACYQAVYEQDTINLKMNTFLKMNLKYAGEMILEFVKYAKKKIGGVR